MLNIAKSGKTIPFDVCFETDESQVCYTFCLYMDFLLLLLLLFSRQCWVVSGDVEFKAVIVRLSSDVGDPRSSFGKFASN